MHPMEGLHESVVQRLSVGGNQPIIITITSTITLIIIVITTTITQVRDKIMATHNSIN